MKLKVDENLPVEVADLVRQAGHDGTNPVEQYLDGGADADVAVICRREGRALVTLDTGFTDILAYPPEQLSGRIVLRPRRQDKPHVLEIFARLIQIFSSEPLEGNLLSAVCLTTADVSQVG